MPNRDSDEDYDDEDNDLDGCECECECDDSGCENHVREDRVKGVKRQCGQYDDRESLATRARDRGRGGGRRRKISGGLGLRGIAGLWGTTAVSSSPALKTLHGWRGASENGRCEDSIGFELGPQRFFSTQVTKGVCFFLIIFFCCFCFFLIFGFFIGSDGFGRAF